jgi:hypothetical protein
MLLFIQAEDTMTKIYCVEGPDESSLFDDPEHIPDEDEEEPPLDESEDESEDDLEELEDTLEDEVL